MITGGAGKIDCRLIGLARKRQLLRYACLQNSHLRKVNSCFSDIVSLALVAFLSSTRKKYVFLLTLYNLSKYN
jgi:hypothetical protein